MSEGKTLTEMALHSGDDWGYHVTWKYNGYWTEAEVREVTATSADGTVLYYGGCGVSTDNPLDVKPEVSMIVKWDGCSHLNLDEDGYTHLCGAFHIKKFLAIIKWLYIRAQELMVLEGGTILDGREWEKK